MVEVRAYTPQDIASMAEVWNEVVEDGIAFPQEETLDEQSATEFFASQTHCGVAVEDGRAVLHVWDNGPGFPEQLLHRLTDPFFRTTETGTDTEWIRTTTPISSV